MNFLGSTKRNYSQMIVYQTFFFFLKKKAISCNDNKEVLIAYFIFTIGKATKLCISEEMHFNGK